MVANQCHKRTVQAQQYITRPLEFLFCSGICQIATVHHKINVPTIHIFHLVTCIANPKVGVADKRDAKFFLVGKLFLNDCHLLGIDACFSLDVHIVGMCLETATRQKQMDEESPNYRQGYFSC